MYTHTHELTPNNIHRIVIYLDGQQVKVIRHKVQSTAIEQKEYYIRMMIGVNGYTSWLKRDR